MFRKKRSHPSYLKYLFIYSPPVHCGVSSLVDGVDGSLKVLKGVWGLVYEGQLKPTTTDVNLIQSNLYASCIHQTWMEDSIKRTARSRYPNRGKIIEWMKNIIKNVSNEMK